MHKNTAFLNISRIFLQTKNHL